MICFLLFWQIKYKWTELNTSMKKKNRKTFLSDNIIHSLSPEPHAPPPLFKPTANLVALIHLCSVYVRCSRTAVWAPAQGWWMPAQDKVPVCKLFTLELWTNTRLGAHSWIINVVTLRTVHWGRSDQGSTAIIHCRQWYSYLTGLHRLFNLLQVDFLPTT